MLKGMVFVDHQNFTIEVSHYYRDKGMPVPRLNYDVLFKNITKLVDSVDFVKAYMYIPKPDAFLMTDKALSNAYDWANGMKTKAFLDVVEGRYIARPTDPAVPMNISDKKTYYKVEKGTDINLAIDAIGMAFHNSLDIAFVVSADTDYLRVYDMLKSLGKLIVVVAVAGQNVSKIRPHVDKIVFLDDAFFSQCLMPATPKPASPTTATTTVTATTIAASPTATP